MNAGGPKEALENVEARAYHLNYGVTSGFSSNHIP